MDENEEEVHVQAFDEDERQRLQNIILDCAEKKKDQFQLLKSRVTDQIAPDYRCHIRAEMYFDLILNRLFKNYYRHQDHLFFDLDLITFNAKTYNGEDNAIYKDAKKLVEHIRMELRKQINVVEKKEEVQQQSSFPFSYQKPIGKLTAPMGNRMSSFSKFLEEEKIPMKEESKN